MSDKNYEEKHQDWMERAFGSKLNPVGASTISMIELKGKCKKDFKEWLNFKSGMKFSERELFYNDRLTLSMQYGVIQDFSHSVDIPIGTLSKMVEAKQGAPILVFVSYVSHDVHGVWATDDQAREASVEALNETYNSQS